MKRCRKTWGQVTNIAQNRACWRVATKGTKSRYQIQKYKKNKLCITTNCGSTGVCLHVHPGPPFPRTYDERRPSLGLKSKLKHDLLLGVACGFKKKKKNLHQIKNLRTDDYFLSGCMCLFIDSEIISLFEFLESLNFYNNGKNLLSTKNVK